MNSGILKTYDPKAISITWGAIIFTDFADGPFIEITQEENFEAVEGSDGSENRVNKNKNGADCTITLQQQSITNDALSTAFLLDKALNNGTKPFIMKDINGTSTYFSAMAYIKKLPDVTNSNSTENRQWMFRLTQLVGFTGGNL